MAAIEAIETVCLESEVTSVLFEDNFSSYKHLQLRFNAASDSNYDNSYNNAGHYREFCWMYFNTTSQTSNSDYRNHWINVREGTSTADDFVSHKMSIPWCAGTFRATVFYGQAVVDIMDHTSSTKNTSILATTLSVMTPWNRATNTPTSSKAISLVGGVWNNDDAITKILLMPDLGTNWRRGSVFTLYGIKATDSEA